MRGLAHRSRANLTAARAVDPATLPLASPYSSSHLQRIAFEDAFGQKLPTTTRSAAMRLPGIKRARNLMVATVARLPLRLLDPTSTPYVQQPGWLTSTAVSSPAMRLLWTVDDLMFYGWSCWSARRGPGGELLAATRLNADEWEITPDNVVMINGVAAKPGEAIVFRGIDDGLLVDGRDVISDARMLYEIVRQRLRNPVPNIDLHQTGGTQLTNEQIDELIVRWSTARQGDNGGVAYTNQWIEAKAMGDGGAELLVEARNASAVDQARIVGVHAGSIDATAPKASLNYETAQGRNQEFVDLDIWAYLLPIVERLSLDDCAGPGDRIAFDLTEFQQVAPAPYGPTRED